MAEKRNQRSENKSRNSQRGPGPDRERPNLKFDKDKKSSSFEKSFSFGGKRSSKFDESKRMKRSDIDKHVPREPKSDIGVHDEITEESDKLEGRNSVMEALKANRTINKLFVSKGEREGSIRQIIAIARQKKIVVTEVEKNVLDGMSTEKSHQGVIAFVAAKEYVEVDDILRAAHEKGEIPFIIILDEITDPHNFGAILRSADAVGAHGVIIPKRRAIGLTSTVSKASAGAIEYIPVSRVTNIAQTIEYLKKNNIWVVGTDSTGDEAFFESDLKGPIALVVGSEGQGMGKLVREKCDFVVNIPMHGQISSLNASVAAAVVMYEILKQRGIPKE